MSSFLMLTHGTSPEMQRDMALVAKAWKESPELQRRLFLMWWDPLAQPIGGQDFTTGNWGSAGGQYLSSFQGSVSHLGFEHQAHMMLPGEDLSGLNKREKIWHPNLQDLTSGGLAEEDADELDNYVPEPINNFWDIYNRTVPYGRFRAVPELWKVSNKYSKQKTREQREYLLEKTTEAVAKLDCPDKRDHGGVYIKFMQKALDDGYEYLFSELRRLDTLQRDPDLPFRNRISMMGRVSVLKTFLSQAPKVHDWKAFKTKNNDPNNLGFAFDQASTGTDENYFFN